MLQGSTKGARAAAWYPECFFDVELSTQVAGSCGSSHGFTALFQDVW